jgi:NAD(P)-dependent dehydrogenase (short-subunit alcohol dehydrogenase family)
MLTGQTAVVTGAGRHIGRAIAEELAERGASVIVNDIDEERAEAVIEGLPENSGQTHRPLVADATDPDEVSRAADTIEQEYDSLDILVNNLGYAVNKDVFETSPEEWYQVLDLCLTSGFLWTKHAGPYMAATGGGSIVNLASTLGDHGFKQKVAYCAAKGGVMNMTRQTAIDLAEYGIRVNSVSPGLVGDPVGKESGRDTRTTDQIPLDRLGEPEDVAGVVVFLASDLADYVTGIDVYVDGGLFA